MNFLPKPENLATGLVLPKFFLQLEYFILKSVRPRDVALHNFFKNPPLGGPCKHFLGGP